MSFRFNKKSEKSHKIDIRNDAALYFNPQSHVFVPPLFSIEMMFECFAENIKPSLARYKCSLITIDIECVARLAFIFIRKCGVRMHLVSAKAIA